MDLDVRPSDAAPVVCVLCRDALGEPSTACSACGVRVHEPCARELGRCPTLGCAGGWGGAPPAVAAAPRQARRSWPRLARRAVALLSVVTLVAWSSTLRTPPGAERVLGGWFSGHGSLPAAVVATFGADAPPALGGVPVEALAFTPDGRRLITAGRGQLIWWDLATGVEVDRARLEGAGATPWLSISRDGRLLAPVGLEAELWDAERRQRIARLTGAARLQVEAAADEQGWQDLRLLAGVCTDEGALLAYASPGAVTLLDVMGAERARLVTGAERVSRVAFAPDATRVAVTSSTATWNDERREVWDLAPLRGPREVPWSDVLARMTFSPDGGRIVWHDVMGTRAWDLARGALVAEVPQTGIGYGVDPPVALSPDGRRAVVASFHGVEVHDLVTGRRVASYPGHGGRRVHVRAAAWSPDGTRFATGGDDQRAIVWRAP